MICKVYSFKIFAISIHPECLELSLNRFTLGMLVGL